MAKKNIVMFFCIVAMAVAGTSDLYADIERKLTDTREIPSSRISRIRFKDILHTDFDYTGEPGAECFTVTFTRTIIAGDQEECDVWLEKVDLDVSTKGDVVEVSLKHPERFSRGVFSRIFGCKQKEWKVTMKVTGPESMDIGVDARFSSVRVEKTDGEIDLDVAFSSVDTRSHKGFFKASGNFSEINALNLDGGFGVNIDFGSVDLRLDRLAENSSARSHFGSVEIRIPRNTGAEFYVKKSFGDTNLLLNGDIVERGEKGATKILNKGGPRVDLETEFGSITVRNNLTESKETPKSSDASRKEELPQSPPPFTVGTVSSVSFTGMHYLPEADVEKLFPIKKGGNYSRENIESEVEKLPEKSKFISGASYSIDTDGNLTVRIDETDLYTWDWDADGSFSRVAGLGLGPRLTIKSFVGPLSEISGRTQYHWGNKNWTYGVDINKHFFTRNRLTFGASYRRDYETNMEWAIPKHDSYLNAFLLGLDTTNYYKVEGSSGYVSQRIGRMLELRGEYFDEDYTSVMKHTNWSLFNHNHTKEDNPPLSTESVGTITGVRIIAGIREETSFYTTDFHLSVEQSYDSKVNSLPEYTRYFGNAVYSFRIPYRSLVTVRTAVGYSNDELPEQRAFRLGGLNTLRGFDFGAVPEPLDGMDGFNYHGGGNRMFLANIDYFIGPTEDFRIVLFGDVGSVWRKGKDIDAKELKRDLGVGLAFGGDWFPLENRCSDELPSGLRINWAVPVGPEKHVSHWTVNFVRAF